MKENQDDYNKLDKQEGYHLHEHKDINRRLVSIEGRLNRHGEEIDKINEKLAESRTDIKHINKNLTGISSKMNALLLMSITALVGFFIWYVQSGGR